MVRVHQGSPKKMLKILIPIFILFLLVLFWTNIDNYLNEKFGFNLVKLLLGIFIFLLIGIAMIIWLGPLVYQQLQSLILEIPKWVNSSMIFVQDIPSKYPDLISSDQITTFFQSLSGQITAISQDFLKASIAGIQNTVTIAINLILLPILVFFFLFDRDSIISGFLSILPKERAMLQNVWVEMDDQLSNYARGKAIEIVIVGLAAAIVFMYFDLQLESRE